ncbi:MAG: S8 family serine peptidase [Planctomycetota bacterium]
MKRAWRRGWATACLVAVAFGAVGGVEPALAEVDSALVGLPPLSPIAPRPNPPDKRFGWIAGTGLDAARRRLGPDMPTGRGVEFGHVEGPPTSYAPDANNPRFAGVRFVLHDRDSPPSNHATSTARVIYGPKGAAPGVDTVHVFPAQAWLTDAYLRAGTTHPTDPTVTARVFTHSWIAPENPGSPLVLRKLDHVVDERDVLVVAGVNNGRNSSVPALLAPAFNVIAVGLANGNNSGGYTQIEREGRCKPDIVAPHSMTSFSTPLVAAMAGRLIEYADRTETADDGRTEVIKAALLAGAFKSRRWKPEPGKPLDERLGAGVVDVDRSLLILEGGPTPPGPTDKRYGYHFGGIASGTAQHFVFYADRPLGECSVILTWHRHVFGPRLAQAALANLDLRLSRQEADGGWSTVAESRSAIDNVEHVFKRSLPAGVYRLEVSRRGDGLLAGWEYALAWRFEAPRRR